MIKSGIIFIAIFSLLVINSFANAASLGEVNQNKVVLFSGENHIISQDSVKTSKGQSKLLRFIEKDTLVTDTLQHTIFADWYENMYVPTSMSEFYEKDSLLTNRFLMPMIFAGNLLPRNFKLYTPAPEPRFDPLPLPAHAEWLQKALLIDSLRRVSDTKIVVTNPDNIDYLITQLPEVMRTRTLRDSKIHTIDVNLKVTPDFKELNMGLPKIPYWRSLLQSSIQFSQVHISENWYQGGTSNLNIISSQNYNLKYDDLKNLQFENNILWKFGVNNAAEDTLRSLRVNEDLFQVNSKVGYRAFKHWYYTMSVYFKTQLFNNYKANTDELLAKFLSPGEFNLGVGMDYKYNNDKRKLALSVILSPLSYNLRFVSDDKNVDPKRFGIKEGNKLHLVGSSIESTFRWEFYKRMIWSARVFYFTNYEKTQVDFENTFDFNVNRFFSTRLFFHTRYDDGVKPRENGSYFQFKELLSFGFNYRF